MARNEEKSQLMLNKWISMKEQQSSKGSSSSRRPYLASECSNLADAEKWRMQIIREVSRKVTEIQNAGLGEHKLRDLNDQINKLLREKGHWQHRIRQLGGPDYYALESKNIDADGRALPGERNGYKYFGAAKDLPGVKELFLTESSAPSKKKQKTRSQLNKYITPDYYGFRDEHLLPDLAQREVALQQSLQASAIQTEKRAQEKRRNARRQAAPQTYYDSSDDDPDLEPTFLSTIDMAISLTHDASNQSITKLVSASADLQKNHDHIGGAPPPLNEQNHLLANRKRDLLALLSS